MTRSTKRILSIMLTIALVFCTVFVFQSTASAFTEDATLASRSMSLGGYTLSGSVTCNATSGTATTKYGSITALVGELRIYYTKSNGSMTSVDYSNSNSATSLTTYKSVSGTVHTVYGNHTAYYNGYPYKVITGKVR